MPGRVFLVNLLFWSGLSAAGPAIAGIFELTEARWAARLRRIATTTVAFMPVSFVLFLLLMVGLRTLYPWVAVPIPKKAAWLNVPFFVLRTIVGVGALYWVSVRFAKAVHASRAGAAEEPGRAERARLAVWLLFLFVIVGSLLGYDLVMSLDPHWFSGLLGGYVVVGMLYSGFAFLVLLTGLHSFGRPGWVMPPEGDAGPREAGVRHVHPVDVLLLVAVPGHLVRQRARSRPGSCWRASSWIRGDAWPSSPSSSAG